MYEKLLNRKITILYSGSKEILHFFEKENIYKIDLKQMKIYENNKLIKIDLKEEAIILNLLNLIDNSVKKYIKSINNEYLKEIDKDFVTKLILENCSEISSTKSYYLNRGFKLQKSLDDYVNTYLFFKKQNINTPIIYNKMEKEDFINLCKNILYSKNITIYKNIMTIVYKEFNLNYDLNDIFTIKLKDYFSLNQEQVKYLLFLIKYKDTKNKYIKIFFELNSHLHISLKKNVLIDLDDTFKLYDLNNFKTIYKIKTNDIEKKNEIKNNIIKNCKNKIKLKDDEFLKSTNFGTIGELLGQNNIVIKDEFIDTNNFNPYFKKRIVLKKSRIINQNDSLVLWDIENINYYNDFSIISRYVKNENQIKIVAYNEKFKSYITNRIDFLLNKLKKRKWIIKETKKIADNALIEEFHKYKNEIKELIVISNDSDFKDIIKEANELNINTIILYRNNNIKSNKWYLNANSHINLI